MNDKKDYLNDRGVTLKKPKPTLRQIAESARITYEADLFKQKGLYQREYKEAVKVYSTIRFGQEPAVFINHAEAMFQANADIQSASITLRFKPDAYKKPVLIRGFNISGICPHCGLDTWSQDLFDLTELGLELAKEIFEPEGMHLATHNPISKRQLIGQHWGAIRAILMEKN